MAFKIYLNHNRLIGDHAVFKHIFHQRLYDKRWDQHILTTFISLNIYLQARLKTAFFYIQIVIQNVDFLGHRNGRQRVGIQAVAQKIAQLFQHGYCVGVFIFQDQRANRIDAVKHKMRVQLITQHF